MDVLYILGSGSRWENRELRYSLRSLEKYGEDVGRIFVTGVNPVFLSSDVVFTPCGDPGYRAFNHIYKVLVTLNETDIGRDDDGDFLLNYDDNFFLEPVDLKNYPYYCRRTLLPDTVDRVRKVGDARKVIRGDSYRSMLVNTQRMLQRAGKPTRSFTIHSPFLYNRAKFSALRPFWREAKKTKFGISPRSVYANYYGVLPAFIKDQKLTTVKTIEDVRRVVQGRPFTSISDKAIDNGVAEFLAEEFPAPSRWEGDYSHVTGEENEH